MTRIFLDANILFSASLPGSRLRDFLNFLLKHKFSLVTNEYAIEEAARNLSIKNPSSLKDLQSLQKKLIVSRVMDFDSLASLKIAEKDIPIAAGANGANCEFLLTGDLRDFGKFMGKRIGSTKVLTPKMLAEELMKRKLPIKLRKA